MGRRILEREGARLERPYRVALIDMALPGFDGETMARAIRENHDLDGTLLMLLTNLGRRSSRVMGGRRRWQMSRRVRRPSFCP